MHQNGIVFRAFSSLPLNVSNVKYLAHLAHQTQKYKNKPSSSVLNVSKFWDMLFESVRTEMLFQFNNFLFSFLSPHSSLFSFLFFLILPQSLRHQTSPTHFNHSFFFSLTLVFSLPFSLTAPPPWLDADLCCYFFFFFFCGSWFDTRFDSRWVEIVMGGLVVVGSNVQIQWWEGWPMDGFQRMGRQ